MDGLEVKDGTPQCGEIFKLMTDAMAKINAIPKARQPKEGIKFAYRGIDDLYNAFHSIFAELGIFVTFPKITVFKAEEVVTKKSGEGYAKESINTQRGFIFTIRFTAKDGSFVTTESVGEGVDAADKASGKATSYAMKSSLIHTFLVPTIDLADPDETNPELERPGEYQTPDAGKAEKKPSKLAELKGKLIEYMQANPPILNADWMKYADVSCKANDLAGIEASIEEAKTVIATRSPK